MKVDHLNSLRALEAVLRTGGLRPAAEDLGVTPAAVGQQIRNLEDYVGRALLKRHPSGSTPTLAAEQVAAALTRHLTGLGGVLNTLSLRRNTDRVSLSVLPTFAEVWLPRHLSTLLNTLSGIDLRLDASRKTVDLHDGEYDFAIRYTKEPSEDYAAALLFDDYCGPVCAPDFAARYDITADSSSLAKVPMAEIDLDSLPTKGQVPGLPDWCKHYGIAPPSPKAGQVILDYGAGSKMAKAGLAIFLAGLHDVIGELEEGSLILPFGPEKILLNSHKFWLIWRKDLRLSSNQKAFVKWITNHADDDRARISRFLEGS